MLLTALTVRFSTCLRYLIIAIIYSRHSWSLSQTSRAWCSCQGSRRSSKDTKEGGLRWTMRRFQSNRLTSSTRLLVRVRSRRITINYSLSNPVSYNIIMIACCCPLQIYRWNCITSATIRSCCSRITNKTSITQRWADQFRMPFQYIRRAVNCPSCFRRVIRARWWSRASAVIVCRWRGPIRMANWLVTTLIANQMSIFRCSLLLARWRLRISRRLRGPSSSWRSAGCKVKKTCSHGWKWCSIFRIMSPRCLSNQPCRRQIWMKPSRSTSTQSIRSSRKLPAWTRSRSRVGKSYPRSKISSETETSPWWRYRNGMQLRTPTIRRACIPTGTTQRWKRAWMPSITSSLSK